MLLQVQELFKLASESRGEVSTQYTNQFWLFFLLMIISWIGQAVVVSVADAICFNLLGKNYLRYKVEVKKKYTAINQSKLIKTPKK